MALPLPHIKRGQSRPVEPLTRGTASGQLLEINSSTPDSAGRGYGRCHACTRTKKNDLGTRDEQKPSNQRKTKVDKANTKNQLNVPTKIALTHALKTSKVTSSCEIKRVLLVPHVCRMNSPKNTPAKKRRKNQARALTLICPRKKCLTNQA